MNHSVRRLLCSKANYQDGVSPQARDREDAQLVSTMAWLSRIGVPRLLGIGQSNAKGLPPQQSAQVSAFYATAQHWQTIGEVIAARADTDAEVRNTGNLGSLPLVVLSGSTAWLSSSTTADETRLALNALHAELAALSTNSMYCEVAGATHGSLVHERSHAQAVVAAIDEVIEAARTGHALAHKEC